MSVSKNEIGVIGMLYALSFAAYVVVVFVWAFVWNIGLFRARYESLAGNFLREPPLFASGIAAIIVQAIAMIAAFALFYPRGAFLPGQALLVSAVVNAGTVSYGALVVPGKFSIANVSGWIVIELAYGALATVFIALAMAGVWWQAG